jgi:hypothetical protein
LHGKQFKCLRKTVERERTILGVVKQGLMVGAPSFPGDPYEGHVSAPRLTGHTKADAASSSGVRVKVGSWRRMNFSGPSIMGFINASTFSCAWVRVFAAAQ